MVKNFLIVSPLVRTLRLTFAFELWGQGRREREWGGQREDPTPHFHLTSLLPFSDHSALFQHLPPAICFLQSKGIVKGQGSLVLFYGIEPKRAYFHSCMIFLCPRLIVNCLHKW